MHLPYWANYITAATGSPMRDHRIVVQPDGWEYSAGTGVCWYNLHHYMICEGFPWQPYSSRGGQSDHSDRSDRST